ncbi:MAG: hypothetical protein QXO84_02560 [Candidatus Aenigmatarchaeota archaeon]
MRVYNSVQEAMEEYEFFCKSSNNSWWMGIVYQREDPRKFERDIVRKGFCAKIDLNKSTGFCGIDSTIVLKGEPDVILYPKSSGLTIIYGKGYRQSYFPLKPPLRVYLNVNNLAFLVVPV